MERTRKIFAGLRRAATGRGNTENLAQALGGALGGQQSQPSDGRLALLADRGRGRGAGAGILGARQLAQLHIGRVEVEEGDALVGEEVVSGDGQHGGAEAVGRVEVEVDSHAGDLGGDVGVHGGHAGDVEERGDGADRLGLGVGVAVTGVVLRTAADDDVAKLATNGRSRKTRNYKGQYSETK